MPFNSMDCGWRLPPAIHGFINLLTGGIVINCNDGDARMLEALFHELLHDGLARTGESMTHDDIRRAARALAIAFIHRGLFDKD